MGGKEENEQVNKNLCINWLWDRLLLFKYDQEIYMWPLETIHWNLKFFLISSQQFLVISEFRKWRGGICRKSGSERRLRRAFYFIFLIVFPLLKIILYDNSNIWIIIQSPLKFARKRRKWIVQWKFMYKMTWRQTFIIEVILGSIHVTLRNCYLKFQIPPHT